MAIKAILAASLDGFIGTTENKLIYDISEDMRFFRNSTKQSIVVMGRKTWESLPVQYRPLKGRINVVISRNEEKETVAVCHFTENGETRQEIFATKSLSDLIDELTKMFIIEKTTKADIDPSDIFFIGGAEIYNQVFKESLVSEVYLTLIEEVHSGVNKIGIDVKTFNENYRLDGFFTSTSFDKVKYSIRSYVLRDTPGGIPLLTEVFRLSVNGKLQDRNYQSYPRAFEAIPGLVSEYQTATDSRNIPLRELEVKVERFHILTLNEDRLILDK